MNGCDTHVASLNTHAKKQNKTKRLQFVLDKIRFIVIFFNVLLIPSEAFQEPRRVSKMERFAKTATYRFAPSKMCGRNVNIKHSRMDHVKVVEETFKISEVILSL